MLNYCVSWAELREEAGKFSLNNMNIFLLLSFAYLNLFLLLLDWEFQKKNLLIDIQQRCSTKALSPDDLAKYFRYLFLYFSLSLSRCCCCALRIIFNYIQLFFIARFAVDLLSEAHTCDFSVVSVWWPTIEATNSSRSKCIIIITETETRDWDIN